MVTFGGDIDADDVAHEGSHVADRQDLVLAILANPLITEQEINNLPQNITKYAREYRAYQVSSAINQAGGRPTEVWNKGWSEADRGTAINKLLKTNKAYKVTPEKPGERLLNYEKKK